MLFMNHYVVSVEVIDENKLDDVVYGWIEGFISGLVHLNYEEQDVDTGYRKYYITASPITARKIRKLLSDNHWNLYRHGIKVLLIKN